MCTLGVGLKAAQDTRLVSATGYSFNANRRVGYFAYIRARRVPIGGTGPQWGDPSAAAGQYRSSCQMSLTIFGRNGCGICPTRADSFGRYSCWTPNLHTSSYQQSKSTGGMTHNRSCTCSSVEHMSTFRLRSGRTLRSILFQPMCREELQLRSQQNASRCLLGSC
jgi:hypothetical protein